MTQTPNTYCDSCLDAAQDEAGFELDDFSIGAILGDMGADIADHLCDTTETGAPCACACNRDWHQPAPSTRTVELTYQPVPR